MEIKIKLRLPKNDDFFDQFGKRIIGTMYFHKSMITGIEPQPYFFNENTDLKSFKELYKNHQVLVPERFSDLVEIINQ